jgi:hypothetical protein
LNLKVFYAGNNASWLPRKALVEDLFQINYKIMPNQREHMETGAWVGAAVAGLANLTKQVERTRMNPHYKFNWGEFLGEGIFGTAAGAFGGALPDLLEPATCPGHRNLFHSVAAGSTMIYLFNKLNKESRMTPQEKIIINSLALGYLSHLVLDSQTPMSLPLICKTR